MNEWRKCNKMNSCNISNLIADYTNIVFLLLVFLLLHCIRQSRGWSAMQLEENAFNSRQTRCVRSTSRLSRDFRAFLYLRPLSLLPFTHRYSNCSWLESFWLLRLTRSSTKVIHAGKLKTISGRPSKYRTIK